MNIYLREARIGFPRAIDYLPADPRETFGVTPRRSMAPEHALFKGTFDCAMHDKAVTKKLPKPVAQTQMPEAARPGENSASPSSVDASSGQTSEAALQIPEGATHVHANDPSIFYKAGPEPGTVLGWSRIQPTWELFGPKAHYTLSNTTLFRPLTPPSNAWIEHDGKGMPVDGETRVEVRTRDGVEYKNATARFWQGSKDWWTHRGIEEVDITHYRIVTPETK